MPNPKRQIVEGIADFAVEHGGPLLRKAGEALGLLERAPRPRQKPDVRYDNPGGDWLKYQRKNAAESRSPVSGAVTAYTRKPIMLNPKKVRALPGHNAERRVPGDMQYDALRPSVEEHGLYEKSPILIGVNYKGEPYIIEGNTRTAVADDLGLPELPAEIRWFAGGEEAQDALLRPDNIEEFMAQSELMRDPRFQKYFEGSTLVDQYGEPIRLYHGTRRLASKTRDAEEATEEFPFFNIAHNDIGVHLGTQGQANDRLATFRYRSGALDEPVPNERIMPVYANIKNPLRMPDLGEWHSTDVLRELRKMFPDEGSLQDAVYRDMQSGRYIGPSAERAPLLSYLGDKGYDAIVYKNKYEAGGAEGLRRAYAARKAEASPLVGDENSYAQAQVRALEAVDDLNNYLGNEANLEDSFIVFDPKRIKSAIGNRGTYDPMDPDITKAKGGLAVKPIWDKKRPKDLGKPKSLSVKRKKSAKARAAAAGRPYPNLIDNMAAARKKGK